jgi:hypothetical protein
VVTNHLNLKPSLSGPMERIPVKFGVDFVCSLCCGAKIMQLLLLLFHFTVINRRYDDSTLFSSILTTTTQDLSQSAKVTNYEVLDENLRNQIHSSWSGQHYSILISVT